MSKRLVTHPDTVISLITEEDLDWIDELNDMVIEKGRTRWYTEKPKKHLPTERKKRSIGFKRLLQAIGI